MALNVTRFAKRSAAILVDEGARQKQGTAEARCIPLNLASLRARYKGQENISIRIERLPHRARLSAGHNNGDHSWSVSLGDLDDLNYLFPADMQEPHTLAIRVINRDGGDGATLAVLDYRIVPADLSSVAAIGGDEGAQSIGAPVDDSALRSLRQALDAAKTEVAARESALAELRQQSERDWTEKSGQLIDTALSKVRAEWDSEFAKRLEGVSGRAETMLESRRQAWQAELDARLAESESRAQEHSKHARELADMALTSAQDAWKAGEALRLAAAETQWREKTAALRVELQTETARNQSELAELGRLREELEKSNAAMAVAHESWMADEASRLAASEAQWKKQTTSALSEVHAEAERNQRDRGELGRIRDELAATKRSLADCESELARVRLEAAQAHEGWRQGTESAITRAKKAWKLEEDSRSASAEARWRELSASALAEAAARQARTEAELTKARTASHSPPTRRDDTELRRLKDEIAALHAQLTIRESELAQQREQSAAALGEVSQRLGRAEAALIEGHSAAQSSPVERDESELRRMTDEVATLRSDLAKRQSELAQAREQWRQEEEVTLARAKDAWGVQQSALIALVEDRVREESTMALESAARRHAMVEAELAQVRAQPIAQSEPNDRVMILRLRDELEKTKINLELRDIELRQARVAEAEALARWKRDAPGAEMSTNIGRPARSDRHQSLSVQEKATRTLIRDVAIVACFAVVATVLFPSVIALIPEGWMSPFRPISGAIIGVHSATITSNKPPSHAMSAATEKDSRIVVRAARVHADPSSTSTVLAILPRDSFVTPIERRGNWLLVPIAAGEHQPSQGWVYLSFLRSVPGRRASTTPAEVR